MQLASYAGITLMSLTLGLVTTACSHEAVSRRTSTTTASPATRAPSESPAVTPSAEPTKDPDLATVRAFTAYADGGRSAVRWARVVDYRVAGDLVARFDPGFAKRRETWDGCPEGATTYEGRDCPVSPLRTLARVGRGGGEVIYETSPPRIVGCNRYRLPRSEAPVTIWIRPDEQHRDCFSDFAVAVSLNGSSRVVAVDLYLSGP